MANQHTKPGAEIVAPQAIPVDQPNYRDLTTEVGNLTNSVAKTVQGFGQQGIKVDVEFSYPPARVKITISW